jgi:hypothetical protein
MNNSSLFVIDQVIIVLSVAFTWICTVRFSKQTILPVRRIPLFFLLFGPVAIATHMCGHLGEISYRAVERMLLGTFTYDYRFYSLILMGIVFLSIGVYMVKQVKGWITGEVGAKKSFIKAALVLIFLSAPTFPFTPIGLLPTLACVISFAALPFLIKVQAKADEQLQQV